MDDARASETQTGARPLTHGETEAWPRARVTLVRRPERARALPALGRSHQDGSERGPRAVSSPVRNADGTARLLARSRCVSEPRSRELVCESRGTLCCASDRWREARIHLRKRRGSRTFQAPGATPWRFGSARHFEVSEGSQHRLRGSLVRCVRLRIAEFATRFGTRFRARASHETVDCPRPQRVDPEGITSRTPP